MSSIRRGSALGSILLLLCCFLMIVPRAEAATGDPLPGVDILVKKKPSDKKTRVNLGGGGDVPGCPADFFGPGSEPFTGEVALACADGVDNDCDSRVDYVEGSTPDLLDVEQMPLHLRSIDPIAVLVNGIDSFFDVYVDITAPTGSDPLAPVPGQVELPAGTVLDPGVSTFVVSAGLDLRCRVTFTEAGTSTPAGSPIETVLSLDMQGIDVPLTRLPATEGGLVALGFDGSLTQPVPFESPGAGLRLTFEANLTGSPVPTQRRSFGAVKASYR